MISIEIQFLYSLNKFTMDQKILYGEAIELLRKLGFLTGLNTGANDTYFLENKNTLSDDKCKVFIYRDKTSTDWDISYFLLDLRLKFTPDEFKRIQSLSLEEIKNKLMSD